MQMPQTRYAKSGDVHIAFQVFGQGERDLVIVPGWTSHMEYAWEDPVFAHFLDRLGSFCRVTWFDKRGTGLSDREVGMLTGVRPAEKTDRVLATILFTDIVDSTKKANELGDNGWRSLLLAHNELVRGELAKFRGHEVKTTGDGFLATFDGPGRAIRCANAIVEGVRSLGLSVRAGLHTGECELVVNDIAGVAVHIASRISAMASSGEVLVSNTVKDLVSGSGIRFEDRGTHSLKGIEGEWRLYRVAN
jgi:class 3 adenylate cyclase